jgi:hypothetical protein
MRLLFVLLLCFCLGCGPTAPDNSLSEKQILNLAKMHVAQNDHWGLKANYEKPEYIGDKKWTVLVKHSSGRPGEARLLTLSIKGELLTYIKCKD